MHLSRDTKTKLLFLLLFLIVDGIVYAVCYSPIVNLFFHPLPFSLSNVCSVLFSIILIKLFDRCEGEIFIFHSLAMVYVATNILLLFCYWGPATPFVPIDHLLNQLDSLMGFHLDEFIRWAQAYPRSEKVLVFAYNSLFYQMSFLILLLGIYGERHAARQFILAFIICGLLGCVFYFFFPSLDAAYSYKDIIFSKEQIREVMQFYQLHHHVRPPSHFLGIISFPSFHVIYLMLVLYYCKQHKLFCGSLLVLNSLVAISTLTTGWHYLIDLIGGVLFAVVTIVLTTVLSQRCDNEDNNPQSPMWTSAPLQQHQMFDMLTQLLAVLGILISTYSNSYVIFGVYLLIVLYVGPEWRKLLNYR